MRLKPCLNLLAFVDTGVIENQVDMRDFRWNLPIQQFEQGDEFHLTLAPRCAGIDLGSRGYRMPRTDARLLLACTHAPSVSGNRGEWVASEKVSDGVEDSSSHQHTAPSP